MTTQPDRSSKEGRLRERIGEFYTSFNKENWESCFKMIDPNLRNARRVEHDKYIDSLITFFDAFGPIQIRSVQVSLHLNEENINPRNSKFDKRDFAYGTVVWFDRHECEQYLSERWVKALNHQWYTRMLGIIVK
jgi:hypothetical protein